jgi:hypothetical protein
LLQEKQKMRSGAPSRRRNPFEVKHRKIISIQWLLLGCTGLIFLAYFAAFYAVLLGNPPEVQQEQNRAVVPEKIIQQNQVAPPAPVKEVAPTGVTIGFAVTITGCGADSITEGAAVLKHSIHLASVHGDLGGRYDYKMYAIYHPDGETCATPLKDLGYELIRRETPVAVKDIEGDFLRRNVEKNGCCGEKELVKLEAYTLVQHPVVVHLDLDVLILKPLDALFDWMLVDQEDLKAEYDTEDVPIMWPELEKPTKVNAYFTRDCKWSPPRRRWPVKKISAHPILF